MQPFVEVSAYTWKLWLKIDLFYVVHGDARGICFVASYPFSVEEATMFCFLAPSTFAA